MWRRWMMAGVVLLLGGPALGGQALGGQAPAPEIVARAARRFPQPVQVGTLIGRAVLEPRESQPVLGRVVAVVRRGDGGLAMVVQVGATLGVGGRPVAVPVEAFGLLGEHVALLDYTPAQLAGFPTVAPGPGLPGGEVIRVGLAKPFH